VLGLWASGVSTSLARGLCLLLIIIVATGTRAQTDNHEKVTLVLESYVNYRCAICLSCQRPNPCHGALRNEMCILQTSLDHPLGVHTRTTTAMMTWIRHVYPFLLCLCPDHQMRNCCRSYAMARHECKLLDRIADTANQSVTRGEVTGREAIRVPGTSLEQTSMGPLILPATSCAHWLENRQRCRSRAARRRQHDNLAQWICYTVQHHAASP
jgi:hypothetical protein